MSKAFKNALGGALLLVLCGGIASAQEFRGRVQGAVSDSTGGIVPGATLTLRNVGTNVAVTRISNEKGTYLFDYVDPGNYKLTAELSGFKTAVQDNIKVQQRSDISVNVKLEVGGLEETVVVTESPVAVQFTTSSHDLTIESEMVKELPSASRNPFGLASLDPTSMNRGSTTETQPYHHRTANEMDLGGGTKYRNDVLLDGTPLTAGNKLGYTPPMDAVTEYTIQQNAVDAEFGHSAGSIALVTMKSGSNQVHGSAYYYGRSPSLNAVSDRPSNKHNENPYWNAGGTHRLARQEGQALPLRRLRAHREHPDHGQDLHAADGPRAPGGFLPVVQRRRLAPRDLRSDSPRSSTPMAP